MSDEEIKNIEGLLKDLESEDETVREDAAAAFIGITDKKVVPDLVRIMLKEENQTVKHFLKKTLLIVQKEYGPIKDIIKELNEKPDKKVEAILKIKESGQKEKLPELLENLKSETDPYITATLISAIGALGDRSHADAIIPFIENDDPRVAANAIEALENLGNPKCVEHILGALVKKDNRIQANAVKALWKFSNTNIAIAENITEKLKEMLFSGKPYLCESSIYVLRKIASEEAVELLKLAMTGKNRTVADKAAEALDEIEKSRKKEAPRETCKAKQAQTARDQKTSQAAKAEPEKPHAAKTETPVQKSELTKTVSPPTVQAAGAEPVKPAKSSAGRVLGMALTVLLLASGGFYYYWFIYSEKDMNSLMSVFSGRQAGEAPDVKEKAAATSNMKANVSAASDGASVNKPVAAVSNAPAGSQQPRKTDEKIKKAEQYISAGFFSEAAAELEEALKFSPEDVKIKNRLIETYFKRCEELAGVEIYDQARDILERIIKLDQPAGKNAAAAKNKLKELEEKLKNRGQ